MSLSRKYLAAALLVAALACTDQPTEPSTGDAFRITPVLPAGSTLATFNLVVDSVYVQIYVYDTTGCVECEQFRNGPGGSAPIAAAGRLDTVLVSESFYWDPAEQSLPLTFELPEIPPHHIFQLYLEMSAGPQILFYGYLDLNPVRGRVVLPPINVVYIGPGYLADSIAIAPRDTSARLIDTLYFAAQAFQSGTPLDTAYIGFRTTDSTKAQITYTGQLTFRPAMAGSTVGVIALNPNGLAADTVYVTVPQPAAAIIKVSGDSQVAPALTPLPSPLVVRVLDAGGNPERGVLVRFDPLGSTGTVPLDSLVFTDSLGLASTTILVGSVQGGVDIEAYVAAQSSIKLSFYATIDPPAPVIWVSDSFGLIGALRRVNADLSGRATMTALATGGIQQSLPRWAPGYKRAAYSTNLGNNNGIILINRAGDSSATYVDDIGSYRPRFSPDGQHVAFQCGGIPDDEQTGEVCVGGGVDGPLSALAGAGNSGSRVLLTDKVVGRSTGPASYAWNPTAPTEIAIVRDLVDSNFIATSAIYRINATGTGVALLSADTIDLGAGPLHVVGPMDWSPDGSRIVFSARNPVEQESSLYLLDVATGVTTRLTSSPGGSFGDNGDRLPTFSPDGSEVLFLRVDHSGDGMGADWHVVTIAGGAVRQVGYEGSGWQSSDLYSLAGDWSLDGNTLLLSGNISFWATMFLVPASTSTNAEYLANRVRIGDGDGTNNWSDQAGSWRP
jgi:hypothetical protein